MTKEVDNDLTLVKPKKLDADIMGGLFQKKQKMK